MKHGILKGDLIIPDPGFALFGARKITLHGRTYQLIGYKSSILKYLIDNGECKFIAGKIASDEYGTKADMNLRIRGNVVGKSASEEIVDSIRGGALGFATGIAPALTALGTAIDTMTAIGHVNTVTGTTDKLADAGTSRPNKFQSFMDHRFGDRIIIDICSFMPDQVSKYHSKVINTNSTEVTFSAVAAAVAGLP